MPVEEKAITFRGIRLCFEGSLPFDEVLSRFRAQVGIAKASEIVRLAETLDEHAFANEIEARFAGKSGFMLFSEIDHGGWIACYGIQRRAVRLIFGNPVIAITMLREDMSAGLFVPVEMLLIDAPEGGTTLTYVQPSSLIAVNGKNETLDAAAKALDAKVSALVASILDD